MSDFSTQGRDTAGHRHHRGDSSFQDPNPGQEDTRTLGDNLSWEEADTYALVLASAHIDYRFRRSRWGWSLEVSAQDVDRAWDEIERFQRENPPVFAPPEPLPETPRTMTGVLAALVLFSFHVATTRHGAHEAFILQAGANAALILNGEYWRTITALTLHGDAKHLAGNMLAIAVFGTLLCKRLGYGAAWLLVVFAGASGNLINAWMHQAQHLSIGASTAVFGTVGLLGGIRLPQNSRDALKTEAATWRTLVRAWILPLGAALGLLAMLGSDAQTDLGAHLFGCLSGLVLGFLYASRFPRPLDEGTQMLFMLAALTLVGGSWWRVGTLF